MSPGQSVLIVCGGFVVLLLVPTVIANVVLRWTRGVHDGRCEACGKRPVRLWHVLTDVTSTKSSEMQVNTAAVCSSCRGWHFLWLLTGPGLLLGWLWICSPRMEEKMWLTIFGGGLVVLFSSFANTSIKNHVRWQREGAKRLNGAGRAASAAIGLGAIAVGAGIATVAAIIVDPTLSETSSPRDHKVAYFRAGRQVASRLATSSDMAWHEHPLAMVFLVAAGGVALVLVCGGIYFLVSAAMPLPGKRLRRMLPDNLFSDSKSPAVEQG